MDCTPCFRPQNSLPPEILAQIFLMVLNDQPCSVFRQLNDRPRAFELHYPKYPEVLMQVCSFWRHTAIACPNLWTHIDIALQHPLNPRLLARSKICVARAGELPLDIHISDIASEHEYQHWKEIVGRRRANYFGLANSQGLVPDSSMFDRGHPVLCTFEFLPGYLEDKVPIRSLELDAVIFGDAKDYQLTAITYFFSRCRPGTFTEYTTRIRNEDYERDNPFIESIDDDSISSQGLRLSLPKQFLENHWQQTRVLRIDGLCPPWSSRAYHGLVELRIGEGVPELHQSQLISILVSSPGLRVLHLGIDVVREPLPTAPIPLKDLETLSLTLGSWFSMRPVGDGPKQAPLPDKILQLIAPGSKPLQLTYFGFPTSALVDFVGRSNMARLFIRSWGGYSVLPIIQQCPHLQTLVLQDCGSTTRHNIDLGVPNCGEVRVSDSVPATRIDTLYMGGFRQHCYEQLKGIIDRYSVQKLVICGTDLWHEGTSPNTDSREIESRLLTITMCPVIHYFESEEIPFDAKDWH